MALPNIRSVRKFIRELCASLRNEPHPWCAELATAIERAMVSPSKWMDLPFFLMVLYRRSYSSTLTMTGALAAARPKPWADMLSPKKLATTVYGDVFEAFVRQALSVFPEITGQQIATGSKRNYDKGIVVDGVRVAVEASVIGESKADGERWSALFEKRRRQHKSSIIGGAYTGDPYELILRVTEKFLDKVAKNCDINYPQVGRHSQEKCRCRDDDAEDDTDGPDQDQAHGSFGRPPVPHPVVTIIVENQFGAGGNLAERSKEKQA